MARPPFDLEDYEEELRVNFWIQKTRKLLYFGDCSIRLTQEELSAVRVRVSVRTDYADANRSSNKRYNPDREFFYRFTRWQDDRLITGDGTVQYKNEIIFDYQNNNFIQNGWANVLTKVNASNILTAQQTLVAGIGNLDPLAIQAMFNENLERRRAQAESFEARKIGTLSPAPFPIENIITFNNPCFRPPEVLWKFTADREDTQAEFTIDSWYWPLESEDFGDPIAPSREGGNSDADSESPDPNGDEPNVPSSESPRDPRNNESDYTSAPAPPPSFPTGTPGRFIYACQPPGGTLRPVSLTGEPQGVIEWGGAFQLIPCGDYQQGTARIEIRRSPNPVAGENIAVVVAVTTATGQRVDAAVFIETFQVTDLIITNPGSIEEGAC